MSKLLGADLNVYSDSFRTFFLNPLTGERIYIILDPCHAEKLARNTLAGKLKIFEPNGSIEWRYIESLYEYSKQNTLRTHKLTKQHIQWTSCKMNVRVACQTLSRSVADSMQFLLDQKHPEMSDAESTIRLVFNAFMMLKQYELILSFFIPLCRYIRCLDCIFDIFNSKRFQHPNIFKRNLNAENKDAVFSYLRSSVDYFKSLKLEVDRYRNHKKIKVSLPILKTANKTAFLGFIIDIESLIQMYNEYVDTDNILQSISTYTLQQDVVEMFFGKIRAKCGYNSNPNIHQFKGAYRQLCVNNDIVISEKANCRYFTTDLPAITSFSNVLLVSSKRAKFIPDEYFEDEIDAQTDDILQEVRMTESNYTDPYTDLSSSFSIVHTASLIESRLNGNVQFTCEQCRYVLQENDKFDMHTLSTNVSMTAPCNSTYEICKTAEKFMRLYDLRAAKSKYNFKVIYCLIFRTLNFDKLFENSAFDCDVNHKLAFIKHIVEEYVLLSLSNKSRNVTLEQHNVLWRKKLNFYINKSGQ